MSVIYLAIAFVFSGFTAVASKALVEMHLGNYRDTYLISSYLTALLLGLITVKAGRMKGSQQDRSVGFLMGAFNCLGFVLFLIVLSNTTGIVAFPIRSLGNLVLTAILSIIAWREKLSKSQWLGIALSLTAIWLLH